MTIAGAANASGEATGAIVIAETDGSNRGHGRRSERLGAFDEYIHRDGAWIELNTSVLRLYLTISAAAASPGNRDSQDRQGQSVAISIDGGTTYLPAACWCSMLQAMPLGAFRKRFAYARLAIPLKKVNAWR